MKRSVLMAIAALVMLSGCAKQDPQAVFTQRMTAFLNTYNGLMPYGKKSLPKGKWRSFQAAKKSLLSFSNTFSFSPLADDAFYLASLPDFLLIAPPPSDIARAKAYITRVRAYMARHASGQVEESTRDLFHKVLGPGSGGLLLYIPFDQVPVFMEFFLASQRGDWAVQMERFETLKKTLAPLIKDNQGFAQELYLPVYIGMLKTGDIAAMRGLVREVEERYPGFEFAGFIENAQSNYEKNHQCSIN